MSENTGITLNRGKIWWQDQVDKLPLTVDAFRLLYHLINQAEEEVGGVQASYVQIGEWCYRATYPETSPAALRKRAMNAMKELVALGLVRVETTIGPDGGQGANRYIVPFLSY